MYRRFTLFTGADGTSRELHMSPPLWGIDDVPSFGHIFEYFGAVAIRERGENCISVRPPIPQGHLELLGEELVQLVYDLDLHGGQPVIFEPRIT